MKVARFRCACCGHENVIGLNEVKAERVREDLPFSTPIEEAPLRQPRVNDLPLSTPLEDED